MRKQAYIQESTAAVQSLGVIGLSRRSALLISAEDQKKQAVRDFSSLSVYDDDEWVIDKKETQMNFPIAQRTLRFTGLPDAVKEDCKDWALDQLLIGRNIKGVKASLCAVIYCLMIIDVSGGIWSITERDILALHDRLFDGSRKIATAVAKWHNLKGFFSHMKYKKQACIMESYVLPTVIRRKVRDKYIPEEVADILDDMFIGDDQIPLVHRAIYWCMRLYPNRIEEVVSMTKDCLKKISENRYMLTIPVSKTAGNVEKPEYKRFEIIYEGIGRFFIDLLLEQKKQAETLLPDTAFLFASRKICWKRHRGTTVYGYEETGKKGYVVHEKIVQMFWLRLSKRLALKDKDGDYVSVTTHKFRHNASTDRLLSGIFRELDVMQETGHKNTRMINENYAHKPEPEERPPAFNGKITDNVRREQAILRMPYAMRIPGLGICSDNRDCGQGMAKCLKCDHVRIDPGMIDYMRHEYDIWKEKLEKVTKIGNDSYARVCREWIEAYETAFDKLEKEDTNGSKEDTVSCYAENV